MSDIKLTAEIDFKKAESQVNSFVKNASKKFSEIMAKATAPGGSASKTANNLKMLAAGLDSHVKLWDKHVSSVEKIQKKAENNRLENIAKHESDRIKIQVQSGKMTTALQLRQIAERESIANRERAAERKALAKKYNDAFTMAENAVQNQNKINKRARTESQNALAKEHLANLKMAEDAVQSQNKIDKKALTEARKVRAASRDATAKEHLANLKMAEDAVQSQNKIDKKALTEARKVRAASRDATAKEHLANLKMAEDAVQSQIKIDRKAAEISKRVRTESQNALAKEHLANLKMVEDAVQSQKRITREASKENIRQTLRTGNATNQGDALTNRINRQISNPTVRVDLINRVNAAVAAHNRILTTFGTRSIQAANAQIALRNALNSVSSQVARQGGLLRTLNNGFHNLSNGIGGLTIAGQRLGRFVVNTQVALSALTSAFGFREILRVTQEIENFENTIKAVSPNAAEAADNMEFLKKSADTVGFSFLSAGRAFSQFSASAYQAGASTEKTQQVFLRVTAATRNIGLSAENTEGVIKALTQSMSKGKFTSEEIRHQLGDRLPFAMQALQKATGKASYELDEMMKKGQVSTSKYMIPFVEELFKASGGMEALENSSISVTAYLARLDNSWTNLIDKAGKNGLNKAFIELFSAFETFLKGDSAAEAMNLFAKSVSAVASGVTILSRVFESMVPVIKVLGNNLDLVGAILSGFIAKSLFMAVIPGIVGTITSAYKGLTVVMGLATLAQHGFNKAAFVMNAIGLVIMATVTAVIYFRKEIASAADSVLNAFSYTFTFLKTLLEVGGHNFIIFSDNVKNAFINSKNYASAFLNGISEVFKKIANADFTNLSETFYNEFEKSIKMNPDLMLNSLVDPVIKASQEAGKTGGSNFAKNWLAGATNTVNRLKLSDIFKDLIGDFGNVTNPKDGDADKLEKYFDREYTKLVRELETLTDTSEAWENYYNKKGLSSKQSDQLAALRDTNVALKETSKIIKELESISDSFTASATDDETARVIKMSRAYKELSVETNKLSEIMKQGNLPEDKREDILKKITENTNKATEATLNFGKALESIRKESEKDLFSREKNVELLRKENKAIFGGYRNKDLDEAKAAREVEFLEESNILQRLNTEIISAQNSGLNDQADRLKEIRDLYEEIFYGRTKVAKQTTEEIAKKAFNESVNDTANLFASGDFSKNGIMSILDSFTPLVDSFFDLKKTGKEASDIFGELATNLLESGKGADILIGIAGSLLGRTDQQNKNSRLGEKIGGQAGAAGFRALGLPPEFGKMLGKIGGNLIGGLFGMSKKDIRETKRAVELNELAVSMEGFYKSAVQLTEVGQRMADLDANFQVLKNEAVRLKRPIDELTSAYQKQRETIQKEFLEGIDAAILGTIDSALQEYAELKKVQSARIKSSLEAETGLAKVRELNARETSKFYENLTADQLRMLGDLVSAIDLVKAKIRDMVSTITSQIDKMQDQARAVADLARQSASALRSASDALRKTITDLQTGSMSPLSPADQFALLLQNFDSISQKALSGDQSSLDKLPDAGNDLLEAAKTMFATGPEYTKIFEKISGVLSQAGMVADVRATALDQIASLAETQVQILEDIKNILATDLGASLADALTTALSDNNIGAGEREVILSRLDSIATKFANVQGPAADSVRIAIENLRPLLIQGGLTDIQKNAITQGYTELSKTLDAFKTSQLTEYQNALIAAGSAIKALDKFLLDPEGKIPAAVAAAFQGGWFDHTLTTRVANLFKEALGEDVLPLPLSGQIYDLVGKAIGYIDSPIPLTDQIIDTISSAIGAGIPEDKYLSIQIGQKFTDSLGDNLPENDVLSNQIGQRFANSIGENLSDDAVLSNQIGRKFSESLGNNLPEDQYLSIQIGQRFSNSIGNSIPENEVLSNQISKKFINSLGEDISLTLSSRTDKSFIDSIGRTLSQEETLTAKTDKSFSDTIGIWTDTLLVDRVTSTFTDTIGAWGETSLYSRINEAFNIAIGGSTTTPFTTTLTSLMGSQSALVTNLNILIASISGLTAATLDQNAQSAIDSTRANQMQSFVNSVRNPLSGIDAAIAAIPDDDPSGSHNNRTNVRVDSSGNVVNIGGNKQSDLSKNRATQLGTNLSAIAKQLETLTGGRIGSFEALASERYSGYSVGGIDKLSSFAGNDFEGVARNFIMDAIRSISGGDSSIIDILKQQDYTNILSGFTSAAQAIFEKNNPRTVLDKEAAQKESQYLARYPDVAAAVSSGQFASGLDHFNQVGRNEFRLYASGGRVVGGMSTFDSVPALLTPNERVLSVPQSRMLETIYSMASQNSDSEIDRKLLEELTALREELAEYRKEQAERDAAIITNGKDAVKSMKSGSLAGARYSN